VMGRARAQVFSKNESRTYKAGETFLLGR